MPKWTSGREASPGIRRHGAFAIRWEGGLLGPELAEALLGGVLPGQRPEDFHPSFSSVRGLFSEVAASFSEARGLWQVFRSRWDRLSERSRLLLTFTQDTWIGPFLSLLGYRLYPNLTPYQVGETAYVISHRAGEREAEAPPVHIVSPDQMLGKVDPEAQPRYSPHALVQEFLNRTDHLWGLVTNGRLIRLLRDSNYIRRQSYVEFDLAMIMEEERFEEFQVLYRLLHRSRLPESPAQAETCWLEKYYQENRAQGGRVRERLRDNVEQALTILANGFLGHPQNGELRARVQAALEISPAGKSPPFTPEAFYGELLRLVYRFLFLLVAEARGLLSTHPLYRLRYGYGLERLRRLALNRQAYTDQNDLWHGLRMLWYLLAREELGKKIGLPPLNGELFRFQTLDGCRLSNRHLLEAFWHLIYFWDERTQGLRRISYGGLDVEELGSVYESLLDYRPLVAAEGAGLAFRLIAGFERKSTGSYYTPHELVVELVRRTVDPVIEARLRQGPHPRPLSPRERGEALLSIRVLDPACGSGHFLLEAARRIGRALARVRTGEANPGPEAMKQAVRDVITHCLYGVDKNPLAVELCRLSLWIEGHQAGKPLTFLEHRIRWGDSLVGVLTSSVVQAGLPDEAFEPMRGDVKSTATTLKKRNRRERTQKTLSLLHEAPAIEREQETFIHLARAIEARPDDTPGDIRWKQAQYQALQVHQLYQRRYEWYNLWTAAFFQKLAQDHVAITTEAVFRVKAGLPLSESLLPLAEKLASQQGFFHWELAFPEVFAQGGFDVILSNPPWERIKLQEEEFFAQRRKEIAEAPNAAIRKKQIAALAQSDPALWAAYQDALHQAESLSRFLRHCGQYPLTGRGDINTYSVFAERIRQLLRPQGRAGLILPTGIATDATNQHFFSDLIEKGHLSFLYDFENREGLFSAVHRSYKFCLLGLRGEGGEAPAFCFFARRALDIEAPGRTFRLSPAEIARLNPNSQTLPIFRTQQDAALSLAIYERVPVLVNERTGQNPWGVRFLSMFHMANDSSLFRTAAELKREGYVRWGNGYVRPSPPSPLSQGERGSPSPPAPRPSTPWPPSPGGRRGEWRVRLEMIARARGLRKAATEAEQVLWERLRDRQLSGLKFRRQHPIGPFIVDFFCGEVGLVVEIDGPIHEEPSRRVYDAWREAFLRAYGLRVVRFTNKEVLSQIEGVLEGIERAVRPSPPSPLSQGERGSPSPPAPLPEGEGSVYLPLYEAKMVWVYQHRHGTYEGVSGRTSTQLPTPRVQRLADPTFLVQPWYWVPKAEVEKRLETWVRPWLIAYRNITSATNERSAVFTLTAVVGFGHSANLLLPEAGGVKAVLLIANMAALPFDWIVRQKLAGLHLSAYYLKQLPVLPPEAYRAEAVAYVVPRVVELVYVAWDMKGFADEVWAEAAEEVRELIRERWEASWGGVVPSCEPPDWLELYRGSRTGGCPLSPFCWDVERRARVQAELDVYYARLYGLSRKQLRYMLDPADLTLRELEDILDPWEEVRDPLDPEGYAQRVRASKFPGESFRVLKEKELREYGEYRTRRLILEAWG